jgi:3-methyladenine DNA glycosylase AlkD
MFGVSFANLNKLQKSIGRSHALAEGLWSTGNHDAQVLATMVADPAQMKSRQLDAWAKKLSNYVLADAFAKLARQSPFVKAKAGSWTTSRNEWIGQAGWVLVAYLAMSEDSLTESEFAQFISTIRTTIHTSKNRTRYAMNSALIAIGTRSARLKQKALGAASQIGTVQVDHGETECKTPNAAQYIVKSWNRKMG